MPKHIITCEICGEPFVVKFQREWRPFKYCSPNCREIKHLLKMHNYHYKNRQRMKQTLLDIYHNRCQKCGINHKPLLQFHHKQTPQNKTALFDNPLVQQILTFQIPSINLQLLCANCHILANIKDKTKNYI